MIGLKRFGATGEWINPKIEFLEVRTSTCATTNPKNDKNMKVNIYLHPKHAQGQEQVICMTLTPTPFQKGDASLFLGTAPDFGVKDLPVILFPVTQTLEEKGCANCRTPEDWQTSDPTLRESLDNSDWTAFWDSHFFEQYWINPSRPSLFDVSTFRNNFRSKPIKDSLND